MSDTTGPTEIVVEATQGLLKGGRWRVREDRPLIFGRKVKKSPKWQDVIVPDRRVSAVHLKLELTPAGLQATDMKSVNGVKLNGRTIPKDEPVPLEVGATIMIAKNVLFLRVGSANGPASFPGSSEGTVVDPGSYPGEERQLALLPYPLAASIRGVNEAVGDEQRTVDAVRHGFDRILRFQTLVALSEYQATGVRHDDVARLVEQLRESPFTLGRWLELHNTLAKALRDDNHLVVTHLATWHDDAKGPDGWRASAGRFVELRNDVDHENAPRVAVAREMKALFESMARLLIPWIGYDVVAVESGTWSDESGEFRYQGLKLIGFTCPFRACVLQSPSNLPAKVPIILSRDEKRRLSLAPYQLMMPAEGEHLDWFMFSESSRGRVRLSRQFGASVPAPDRGASILTSLLATAPPSRRRAGFAGSFSEKGRLDR